jgi:S-adenosylmethionine:tRNA ribosyltransferase-isomerase
MPLPPYIERQADASDVERYQTVFAREPGAVAAPTAGLHFDESMLKRLRERGVDFGYITLHVGAGTFQPVRADDLKDHRMHREWLNVGAHLIGQIRRTRTAGGRVIAVGTTVIRALESASKDGQLHPFAGETQIFIFPGYRFTSIDGIGAGRARIHARCLPPCGRATLPFLFLWRCHADPSARGMSNQRL